MKPPRGPVLEVQNDLAGRLGMSRLLVWRDDRASVGIGGAKARNLRVHLDTMRERGCTDLLITARAGSNLVMAASRLAPPLGIAVTAVLRPQPDSVEARHNLAVTLACGTCVIPVSLDTSLRRDGPFMRALCERMTAEGRAFSLIGFGGGEQDAGRAHVGAFGEMARVLAAKDRTVPEVLYMAGASFSSGVGVALGLARSEWPTTLVLVNVAQDLCPGPEAIGTAVLALADALGVARPVVPGIRIIDRLAPGFGQIGAPDRALAGAAIGALRLDQSYTAKAFAALCEDALAGRTRDALFWHSGVGRPEWPAGVSPVAIPPDLAQRLLLPPDAPV